MLFYINVKTPLYRVKCVRLGVPSRSTGDCRHEVRFRHLPNCHQPEETPFFSYSLASVADSLRVLITRNYLYHDYRCGHPSVCLTGEKVFTCSTRWRASDNDHVPEHYSDQVLWPRCILLVPPVDLLSAQVTYPEVDAQVGLLA
jgi:hypothetical protein